jgi:hypothetical protein
MWKTFGSMHDAWQPVEPGESKLPRRFNGSHLSTSRLGPVELVIP